MLEGEHLSRVDMPRRGGAEGWLEDTCDTFVCNFRCPLTLVHWKNSESNSHRCPIYSEVMCDQRTPVSPAISGKRADFWEDTSNTVSTSFEERGICFGGDIHLSMTFRKSDLFRTVL